MKPYIPLFFTLLTASVLFPFQTAAAEDLCSEDGRFSYTITDGAATVTAYHYAGEEDDITVIVPDILGGCPVTTLADGAFRGSCVAEEIIFPDTLAVIGESCFAECSYLKRADLPDGLQTIGYEAFAGCHALASVAVPDSVTEIGAFAFESTAWQDDYADDCMIFGDGLLYRYVGDGGTVTIPDSVTEIGAYSFYDCASVTAVSMPDTVKRIGDCAFEYCTALTEFSFPPTLDALAGDALVLTTWFEQYPDDCVMVGDILYKYKGDGKQIVIPDTTRVIGAAAFERCTPLTELTIPSGVEEIRDAAFYQCTALQTITLPDTLRSIGELCFYNCTALARAELPQSLISIAPYAFSTCTSLTQMTIPQSVTEIGEMAVGYYYDYTANRYARMENFTIYSDSAAAADYAAANGITLQSAADASELPPLTVTEPSSTEHTAADKADASKSFPWWIFVIIAGAALICGAVFVRKKKKE